MTERQGSTSKQSKSGSTPVAPTRSAVKPSKATRASQADRHELYELAVQDPPSEVRFIGQTFKRLRGRPALSMREDFAGTSVFSLEWVRSHKQRTAICVDLDRATLDWGLTKRIRPAGADYEQRIIQRCANVLEVQPPLVDVAVGFNFSYWCFDTRPALLEYFRAARAGLVADGMLVLDAYGGTEVPQHEITERETRDGEGVVNGGQAYTYIWEQIDYNPVDARMNCAIHFEFKDGSRLDRAFSYSWRVWTLPEIRELLLEAGFAKVRVWAEREDEAGEGTGRFHEAKSFDNEGVWWVYITAEN
ncbi:class I SAM-dependent methyltransferase [Nannocystaceae bacterium ST9]